MNILKKLCLSIGSGTHTTVLDLVRSHSCVELRFDLLGHYDQLEEYFETPTKIITTCRAGRFSERERYDLFQRAIAAGTWAIDLECEAVDPALVSSAKDAGVTVILSFHQYDSTPDRDTLDQVIQSCKAQGADIIKVACTSHSERDNARLLGLLERPERLIVIGMGEQGKETRLLAPLLGSELTFVSTGVDTAPGQLPFAEAVAKMEQLMQVLHHG